VNWPVAELNVAPGGRLGPDIVSMLGGTSGSLQLTVKVSGVSSGTVWGPGTDMTGGLFTSLTVMVIVSESVPPIPSSQLKVTV